MSGKHPTSDNPFAALNAALFPSAEGGKQTSRPKTKEAASAPNDGAASSSAEDSDADLFLSTIGGVTRLNKTPESSPHKKAPTPPHPAKDGKTGRKDTSGNFMQLGEVFSRKTGPVNRPEKAERELDGHSGKTKLAVELSGMKAMLDANTLPPQSGPVSPTAPDLSEKQEEALEFLHALDGVRPLPGKGRDIPLVPPPPRPVPTTESNPLQDILDGKVHFALNATDEYVEAHVIGLDLITVGKLQARHYSPEAHIDLHGLNSEQAYYSLAGFFKSSYYKGARTVLVVTGRGKNSPGKIPVIRQKVQEWLVMEPFKRVVLAFCTARQEDGGAGALYVMLRKRRKNSGKIRWDAYPRDPDLL